MTDKTVGVPRRRRQWGAERRTAPLPTLHARPTDRAIVTGRLAILLTVGFWVVYLVYTVFRQFLDHGTESFRFTTEAVSYLVVVTFLTFSALMHLVARQGALERFAHHVRVPRAELDRHFGTGHDTPLTVLVPSYAEEPDVVAGTLWSAALQEYPSLRVVLLLDDPPVPTDPAVRVRLEATRALARTIQDALAAPAERFREALLVAEIEAASTPVATADGIRTLAAHYTWAAAWLRTRAVGLPITDHVDLFQRDHVLGALADDLTLTATALRAALDDPAVALPSTRVVELHRRLAWTFQAELTTFERKRYANLSHEANKAMNLNAYIGLLGTRNRFEDTAEGTVLRRLPDAVDGDGPGVGVPDDADLVVPAADYVLTLDADSVLLREYCLRLVYFLEQPENARVAVTQTPYSAFRGAPTRIERLAGATTDIQHVLHQGMSAYQATFWVGANAVIRTRALRDIEEVETVGGHEVRRYVQDRTVIEDTESSVDLGMHGWTLVNYPERLSYSATPPDFGSLVVQRRRWANGGLLILPKYLRQVRERRARGERVTTIEIALRVNYMASITWSSFGLVFLLAYPYDSRLLSPVVLLAAIPYFVLLARDLRSSGYRWTDVFRVYGFNLVLMPVNVAGVLKSIGQAITSKKIPFARTPKVRDRTATPGLFVLAPYGIVAFSLFTLWRDAMAHNWGNAVFAGVNAVLAAYAIVAYIGVWSSIVDLWLAATAWMWFDPAEQAARRVARRHARRVRRGTAPLPEPAPTDWRAVLYFGHADTPLPRHVPTEPTTPSTTSTTGAPA